MASKPRDIQLTSDEWALVGIAVAERAAMAQMAGDLADEYGDNASEGMAAAIRQAGEKADEYKALALKLAAMILDPHRM